MVDAFSEYATRPEPVYEQAHGSISADTTDEKFAVLGGILRCRPYKREVSAALLGGFGVRLERPRDIHAVGARVVGLLTKYPWLQPQPNALPEEATIHFPHFQTWVEEREFEDYPGLYGISSTEGHLLAAHINGQRWDPRGGHQIAEFCDRTGIINDRT